MDINVTRDVKSLTTKCNQCAARKTSLFKNLAAERLNQTQRYRDSQIEVPVRSIIFHEGEYHPYVYTLYSGWGIIYKTVNNNNKRQILRFILPGDLIGYQTNSIGVMSHSAASVTEAVFCVFPRKKIKPMLKNNPDLAIRFLEMWSRDMSLCQSHLVMTGRKTARESISFLLLELYYRVKYQAPESFTRSTNTVYFPITQEDIGDALGLTKVHVNRVIKSLVENKLIYCHKKKLTILNEKKLSELAEFNAGMIATSAFP